MAESEMAKAEVDLNWSCTPEAGWRTLRNDVYPRPAKLPHRIMASMSSISRTISADRCS